MNEPQIPTVPAIKRQMYDLVAEGRAKVIGQEDGEPVFQITQDGIDRVEGIFQEEIDRHGDDAAAALSVRLDLPFAMCQDMLDEYKARKAG